MRVTKRTCSGQVVPPALLSVSLIGISRPKKKRISLPRTPTMTEPTNKKRLRDVHGVILPGWEEAHGGAGLFRSKSSALFSSCWLQLFYRHARCSRGIPMYLLLGEMDLNGELGDWKQCYNEGSMFSWVFWSSRSSRTNRRGLVIAAKRHTGALLYLFILGYCRSVSTQQGHRHPRWTHRYTLPYYK